MGVEGCCVGGPRHRSPTGGGHGPCGCSTTRLNKVGRLLVRVGRQHDAPPDVRAASPCGASPLRPPKGFWRGWTRGSLRSAAVLCKQPVRTGPPHDKPIGGCREPCGRTGARQTPSVFCWDRHPCPAEADQTTVRFRRRGGVVVTKAARRPKATRMASPRFHLWPRARSFALLTIVPCRGG